MPARRLGFAAIAPVVNDAINTKKPLRSLAECQISAIIDTFSSTYSDPRVQHSAETATTAISLGR